MTSFTEIYSPLPAHVVILYLSALTLLPTSLIPENDIVKMLDVMHPFFQDVYDRLVLYLRIFLWTGDWMPDRKGQGT